MKRLFTHQAICDYRKAGKYLLITVLLLALLWLFTRKVTSKEAFINASITQIASPIPGTLAWLPGHYPGVRVTKSQPLGMVTGNASNAQISQLKTVQQTTEYRIADLSQQLNGNQLKIAARQKQWQQYQQESQQQQQLQRDYTLAGYQQAKAQEAAASQQAFFARAQLKRAAGLHRQGYLSDAGFERQRSEAAGLLARAQASQAESRQKTLDSEAARLGLQLSGARTLTGPEQNQRDLQLTLDDLQQVRGQLQTELAIAQRNLSEINLQLAQQQQAEIRSTLDGMIWAVNAREGNSVSSNSNLIEVIDCQNSWVEAFFDESAAGQLQPGAPVTVSLSPSDNRYGTWQGNVEAVRAGSGRVAVGESIVMPPPEIARRQLPVKVVTARIRIAWPAAIKAGQVCLAGRSVSVAL